MYNILEFRQTSKDGRKMSSVMTEGQINDVAVYEHEGHVDAEFVARHGFKMSESSAIASGWIIPEGKHYRW